jgi:hypothetical protein
MHPSHTVRGLSARSCVYSTQHTRLAADGGVVENVAVTAVADLGQLVHLLSVAGKRTRVDLVYIHLQVQARRRRKHINGNRWCAGSGGGGMHKRMQGGAGRRITLTR